MFKGTKGIDTGTVELEVYTIAATGLQEHTGLFIVYRAKSVGFDPFPLP